MNLTTTTIVRPDDLPAAVRSFLVAHAARDVDGAARSFTVDAVVVDQDETYAGSERVLDFLRSAGSEFTYTTELVEARRLDETRWAVLNRIEGDFPGNVADLTYRFTVVGGRISELTIG